MSKAAKLQRKLRTRASLKKKAAGRPRLSVFRSNQHIYAQVIDDDKGVTLAAASTQDDELKGLKSKSNKDAAKEVGKLIATRAVAKKVKQVVFDRGGYIFHGRVKSLAEGAREGGLDF